MTATPHRPAALDAWGGYDLDDPFPVFAEVLAQGAVHEVTLNDGHRAFLVVGFDAAREALNHPHLSKDMEAALDAEDAVVAEGLPGRDFARHLICRSAVDVSDGAVEMGTAAAQPDH